MTLAGGNPLRLSRADVAVAELRRRSTRERLPIASGEVPDLKASSLPAISGHSGAGRVANVALRVKRAIADFAGP